MKAATLKKPGGLDNIVIRDRAQPEAGLGELLIKVGANSLNYHDYVVALGGIPTADGRVLMSDAAGDIISVGEGVSGWSNGDHALSLFFPLWPDGEGENQKRLGVPGDHADGFAAEYVAVPASAVTKTPQGYSFTEAATLPCAALTAWRALMVATHTKPGDMVLVQGSGGVSIFALQFAKAAGATVIATSSSGEKLDKLRDLGADHLINYKEDPEWGKSALAWTGGRGVDTVVEIGGPGTLTQSIYASRTGGHIGLIGVLTGLSGEVPTALFFQKNLVMTGITVGSHVDQRDMIGAIEANGIKPVIDRHFPLEQLGDAFQHQAAQKHFGKIVIDIPS